MALAGFPTVALGRLVTRVADAPGRWLTALDDSLDEIWEPFLDDPPWDGPSDPATAPSTSPS
jgi:hypothetical protein